MDLAAEAIRVLKFFRNIVVEGPPGTGKTFVVDQIAGKWTDHTGRVLAGAGTGKYAITMHPGTTYEEFVDGLRFDEEENSFIRKPGFLLNVIDEAEKNPHQDYLVLLDEINRANIPKVLGDVLLCMEKSKRTRYDGSGWAGGFAVTLPYSGDLFSIPDNIYLLGTMNSSDRSIAPLDSALRRRFGFLRADPIMGEELIEVIEGVEGKEAAERVSRSVDELTNLNEILRAVLGPDATLGHSYLFGLEPMTAGESQLMDPLAPLRQTAQQQSSTRAFWLEVSQMWFGAHNQLDVPDATSSRRGLVREFYPMTSQGATTETRSVSGTPDPFDLHFRDVTLAGNTLEYNEGGSNVRIKYKGKSPDNRGIGSFAVPGSLQQKVHVWLARPDNTFDLVVLDRTDEVLKALKGVSSWSERTMATPGGRSYGEIDLAKLSATAEAPERTPDEDAEWLTWRYVILPQLVDTLTQLGATDLFDPITRADWLQANPPVGVEDRLTKFDEFLASLALGLREEGHGLGRALVVTETPIGAQSYATSEDGGSEDEDEGPD